MRRDCGDEVARLAAVFGPLLQRQGYLDETLAGYEAGIRAATSREVKATLHRSICLALITARRLDAALRAFQASLAIEEELGNVHGAGLVHVNIGIVYIRMGRFADALTSQNHSFELLREVGTKRDKAAVRVNLGVAHIRLGNPYIEATALFNIGHARSRSGEVNEALHVLERARDLAHQIGATEMEPAASTPRLTASGSGIQPKLLYSTAAPRSSSRGRSATGTSRATHSWSSG